MDYHLLVCALGDEPGGLGAKKGGISAAPLSSFCMLNNFCVLSCPFVQPTLFVFQLQLIQAWPGLVQAIWPRPGWQP